MLPSGCSRPSHPQMDFIVVQLRWLLPLCSEQLGLQTAIAVPEKEGWVGGWAACAALLDVSPPLELLSMH